MTSAERGGIIRAGHPRALSIVIPTFNTSTTTLAACRAALASAPESTEVIVVDDASTDDTRSLIERTFPEVELVTMPTNQGFAAAANAGVARSSAPLIMLLNSDALVDAGGMRALVSAFTSDPELGVAGARLVNGDGAPQWSGGSLPTHAWLIALAGGFASILPRSLRTIAAAVPAEVSWVSGAAMMFRRSVWETAGPLSERYRFYAQDLEFCARARDAGWKVRIVEEAQVVHEGGVSVRKWRELEGLPHDPAMLWLDLLSWSRGHYGEAWSTAARVMMFAAALVRVGIRRAHELTMTGETLRRSRSTTRAYAAALAQLLVERK